MITVFISFLLSLFVFGILFRKAIKNKKRRKMIPVLLGILFIMGLLSAKAAIGFVPLPAGIRHFAHLLFAPKGLYQPIVYDNFQFYKKGFTKTYPLLPKYLDYYMIGFVSEKQNISIEYKFKGKLKAEFFWKGKFLFEKVVTSQRASWQSDNDHAHYKSIDLIDFEVPLKGRYKDDISVRLTVLEPDEDLKEYGDSVKLFIGVSSVP